MVKNKTMVGLVKPSNQAGLNYVEDLPIPTCGSDEVLIKVITSSVCGTDLHIYKSDQSITHRVADNQIIGHEFYGEVIEIGNQVNTHTIGDHVSSESHIVDNTCYQCLNGQKHLCQNIVLVGIDRPGGLAQYVALPASNAVIMNDEINSSMVSPEVASFMDAYGNAVDTATVVSPIAKTILVTGAGPQGLMVIAISIACGAKQVIATEVTNERIALAQQIISQHANQGQRNDLVLNAKTANIYEKVMDVTGGVGVDILMEMSGSQIAITDGLRCLRNGGDAVILGVSSGAINLDWPALIFKGITVHFRYGRKLYQTWTDGRRLLQSGTVKLDSLVHPKSFALSEFQAAFDLLLSGGAAKIIFRPNG